MPVSRYQLSVLLSGATRAACQRRPLGPVGAAVITTRGKVRAGIGNVCQHVTDRVTSGDLRRVSDWSDHDKIIVHQVMTIGAIACGDEIHFQLVGMRDDDITIAVARIFQRLSGSDRNHPHLGAAESSVPGQQIVIQAGIVGRCGGLQDEGCSGTCRHGGNGNHDKRSGHLPKLALQQVDNSRPNKMMAGTGHHLSSHSAH